MRTAVLAILVVAALVSQVGCATSTIGGVDLLNVDRPADLASCAGEIKPSETPDGPKVTFEDQNLAITWTVVGYSVIGAKGASSMSFELQNKTDSTMRILWDNASFVDESGGNHRIMHSGVRYMERDKEQPPTVIAKKGKLSDSISTTDTVVFDPNLGWIQTNFITKNAFGKTVKVLLPIEIDGKPFEYTFEFKVLPPVKKK